MSQLKEKALGWARPAVNRLRTRTPPSHPQKKEAGTECNTLELRTQRGSSVSPGTCRGGCARRYKRGTSGMDAAAAYAPKAYGKPTSHSSPPPSSQSANSPVPCPSCSCARVPLSALSTSYLKPRPRCPAMLEHAETLCIDDLDEQQLHLPRHIHRIPRRQLQTRRTTGKVGFVE
jgi:hypothetical protein